MAYRAYERSIPDIITDLLGQFPTLVRKESQLARAEMSEKITRVGIGIALIGGGAVLLIPALVILLEAGVAALQQEGFNPTAAALIVGGCALVIGLILLMVGISRLKAENMVPEKTIHQLQEAASMAKRQVRSDDDYERAA
jgi:Putative Actinobacterial Holin-X, holin superfamily III